jgi:hypothetical protein
MFVSEIQKSNFWLKVEIAGPDDCWPWRGCLHKDGYGIFTLQRESDGKNIHVLSHRVAAFLAGMTIDGVGVFHTCDNPPCCNQRHFFTGTQAANVADMVAKGRGADTRGQKNPRAKLTNRKVSNIRRRIAQGDSIASIARDYGCGWTTISHIKSGHTWSHIK